MDALLEELRRQGLTDSSGSFTVDFHRLEPLLGRFQLPSPERCILRLVAAAVAGGAQKWGCQFHKAGYRVEFDGRPYTAEDLDGLFLKLLSGEDARLSEMAVALNAARSFGARVRLQSQGGALVLEGARVRRESQSHPHTRVEFSWPTRLRGLWRRWQQPERGLLAQRCSWSPLRVISLKSPPKPGVQFGHPPGRHNLWSYPRREDQPPAYVWLRSSRSRFEVVVHGVSYACPPVPHTQIVCWADLPLDLARERLVDGDQLKSLRARVEQCLEDLLLREETLDPRYKPWLAARSLGSPALREAFLFELSNSEPTTLKRLEQQFKLDGYLPVSRTPFVPHNYEPCRVILRNAVFEAVSSHFPHQVEVSHTASPPPRLPPEVYLARVPLRLEPGEMAFTLRGERQAKKTDGVSEPAAAQGYRDLYRALAYQTHSEERRDLVTHHLLDYLQEASKSLTPAQLQRELAPERAAVELRTVSGQRLKLGDLERPINWFVRKWSGLEPAPPGCLELPARFVGVVGSLLPPGSLRDLTRVLEETLGMQRLATYRSEAELVRALNQRRHIWLGVSQSTQSPLPILERARAIARRGWSPLSSEHVAWALLEGQELSGAERDRRRAELVAGRAQEAVAELDEWIALSPLPVLLLRRAGCLLVQGHPSRALGDACQALAQGETVVRLSTLATALAQTRQPEAALEARRRSLEVVDPETLPPLFRASVHSAMAEHQLEMGQPQAASESCQEALRICPSGTALGLMARLHLFHGSKAEALRWAERALTQSDRPASVHETRALAGGPGFREFVEEVELYGLVELDLEERLTRARQALA